MTELNHWDSRYRGVRVAVLGASGFMGRWVVLNLCARGAKVYLFVRNKVGAKDIFSNYNIHGDIFEVDLRKQEDVRKLFQRFKPSITFNLAGYGVDPSERDEQTAYQINAYLVEAICEVIAEIRDPDWLGQDIVHIGSALEYGAIGGNLSESSIPNPTTLYGKTKLAGTQSLSRCCEAHGIRGLTARLFTVYGPGEHAGRLLPSLLETAKTGKPLSLTNGDQKRDFTYVEDVAEGLVRLGLAKTKPGEVVNLATGKLLSVRSFVETVARILHIANDSLRFGLIPTRPEEMKHNPVTLERLLQLIAWIPPLGVAEGVQKTLAFKKTHRD